MCKAVEYYNEFLKNEKAGNYVKAWEQIVFLGYCDKKKDKGYTEVMNTIYSSEWFAERYYYMRRLTNDREMQMVVACIFDDAESRQDGLTCYISWQILHIDYRWYSWCLDCKCMGSIKGKYSDWERFKEAMELKAKELGFDVHK